MSPTDDKTLDGRPSVYFVASQTMPRHGMETALIRTIEALSDHVSCQVLVLRDQAHDVDAPVPVRVLGSGRFGRGLALWRLWRLQSQASPHDVFIGTGLWASVPLVLTRGKGRARVLAWEHSLLPERFRGDRKLRLLSPLVGFAYAQCKAVVCVSPPVAETVMNQWPRTHVQVIPNIFRSTTMQSSPAEPRAAGAVYIAFIGSLRPVKNVKLLIRSLRHVPHAYRLLVAGQGPEEAALRTLAEETGVSDRIEWLGATDGPEEVLARADVLAHPSSSETFAYTLLEACSASVPVATLDRPVMNRLVPDYAPGVVADSPTPAAFARAIVRAHTEHASYDFGVAQELCASSFSAEKVGSAWLGLLLGKPLPKPRDAESHFFQQSPREQAAQAEG